MNLQNMMTPAGGASTVGQSRGTSDRDLYLQDREHYRNLFEQDRAHSEAREDSAMARMIAQARELGIHPATVLGANQGAQSVVQQNTARQKEQKGTDVMAESLRIMLTLGMIALTRGTVRPPRTRR